MLLAGFTWSTGHPEAVWLLAGVWLLLLVGGCLLLAAAVSTKAAMEVLEAAAPSGRSVCATGQPAAAAFSISSALGMRLFVSMWSSSCRLPSAGVVAVVSVTRVAKKNSKSDTLHCASSRDSVQAGTRGHCHFERMFCSLNAVSVSTFFHNEITISCGKTSCLLADSGSGFWLLE